MPSSLFSNQRESVKQTSASMRARMREVEESSARRDVSSRSTHCSPVSMSEEVVMVLMMSKFFASLASMMDAPSLMYALSAVWSFSVMRTPEKFLLPSGATASLASNAESMVARVMMSLYGRVMVMSRLGSIFSFFGSKGSERRGVGFAFLCAWRGGGG